MYKRGSPWTKVKILAVGMVFSGEDDDKKRIVAFRGHDGKERIILNLSNTTYYVLRDILEKNSIVPEVGLTVEVMVWGSEICAMRMPPECPDKSFANA